MIKNSQIKSESVVLEAVEAMAVYLFTERTMDSKYQMEEMEGVEAMSTSKRLKDYPISMSFDEHISKGIVEKQAKDRRGMGVLVET